MERKVLQPVVMPDDGDFFEVCYNRNGNRARCTTFSKIWYFFNEDGSITEIIKLGDDEFKNILKEEGIDPSKPYGPWMIMPKHYVSSIIS